MKNKKYTILTRNFYTRDTVKVAHDLLGKLLVRRYKNTYLSGIISEVEAYLPFVDPAAHSYQKRTPRTVALYGEAGYAYIYSIHRQHCFDVVTEAKEIPGSVLLRGIWPVAGIKIMQKLRNKETTTNLTNGPGKLCQALAIDKKLYGTDLTTGEALFISESGANINHKMITTTRIGISQAKELPLRFLLEAT